MITLLNLIIWLLVGALAGWLAGQVVKGSGFGLFGNIVVGILGSFIGGFIFRMVGFLPTRRLLCFFPGAGLVGNLVSAFVGAIILIYVARLLTQK